MRATGLILFAHGSRDPQWAAPFQAIRDRIAAAEPALTVELAFLELMQPTLGDAVARVAAQGIQHIAIAPLFMGQGAHVKRDLMRLKDDIESARPELEIDLLPAAGEIDAVLDAISDAIVERLSRITTP